MSMKTAISGTLDLVSGELNGAELSSCRTYRYRLFRIWDETRPQLNFVMLNPSTADEQANDPTIERCLYRARKWGYGGLVVTNLFAYRSTDPRALKQVPDPIGPENDTHILEVANLSSRVICAWGNDGKILGRAEKVLRMLKEARVPTYALKVANTGQPYHPLYLSYELLPMAYPVTA